MPVKKYSSESRSVQRLTISNQRRNFLRGLVAGVGSLSFVHNAFAQTSGSRAIPAIISVLLNDPVPEPATLPTVVTNLAFDILASSASVPGEVVDDGGATIIERGVVFATTELPTVATGSKVIDASAEEGEFTASLTGLSPITLYYARGYAINSEGTAYGNQIFFITLSEPPI